MDLAGLIVFASAYTLAVASPGPGVTALVARVLGRGLKGAPALIAGYVIGDLVWYSVAAGGLAALAKTFATAFLVIKWVGVGYLLYLAYKMWTAPAKPLEVEATSNGATSRQLFVTGLTVTLGNPKVMAFFLALLPTIVDLKGLTLTGFVEVAGVAAVILSSVLTGYALLAERARRLVASSAAMKVVNRACGAAIAGAAAMVAARS